jgi:ApaG protein
MMISIPARFTATTHDIEITVTPIYLESQSFPHTENWSWAYHVRMQNTGQQKVQLVSRYWKIIDAKGFVKEVRGPGVVGETPVLNPGEVYEYSSGTMLPTSSGIMSGYYYFSGPENKTLEITIPAFSLDSPSDLPKQMN